MTEKRDNSRTSSERSAAGDVRQLFSKLPFDQRISTLVKIELDLLGDAVEAVVSATSKAIDEAVEVCKGSKSTAPGAGSQSSAG